MTAKRTTPAVKAPTKGKRASGILSNYPAHELRTLWKQGYAPAKLCGEGLGLSIQSIYQWLAAEKITGQVVAGIRRYVKLTSVRKHVGPAVYDSSPLASWDMEAFLAKRDAARAA